MFLKHKKEAIFRGAGGSGDATGNVTITEIQNLRSEAQLAADEAELAQGYAEEWANKAEDSLVSTAAGGDGVDDYSSLHWNAKTLAIYGSTTDVQNAVAAASTSASNAATSETNAAASETAAELAETNAETAQVAAELAETNAELAKDEAEAAQVAAELAEDGAVAAQVAAELAETNAETAEVAAELAETNAAASASAASTSASNAATSETNAAASASAAATSETNAATSETNAATSASNAATSETNAATSETNAAASATAAAASATEAAASAASIDLDSIAITGGTITGITDLAIADGGTGSSTASGARTNLGLSTGATSTVTTSATDTTTGRLLKVGDFGQGTYIKNYDLSNQVQTTSYRKSVIALCELTNTDPSANSYSAGEITFHRTNSINPEITCKIQIAKQFNVTKPNSFLHIIADLTSTFSDIKVCTFTYNGVKYGGLHFYYADANHSDVIAKLSGNFVPFGVDYYDTQTATALNTEINNSLDFDDNNRVQRGIPYHTGNFIAGTDYTAPSVTVAKTSSTGSAIVPTGTEAQRDGSPAAGYFRFNSDEGQFEGYNGSVWGAVGGGATGGGGDQVFVENSQTVTTDYTIPSGKSASSTGPITINTGVTITISSGSVWVIL